MPDYLEQRYGYVTKTRQQVKVGAKMSIYKHISRVIYSCSGNFAFTPCEKQRDNGNFSYYKDGFCTVCKKKQVDLCTAVAAVQLQASVRRYRDGLER